MNEQSSENGRLFWQFQRAGDGETGCGFGFDVLRLSAAQTQNRDLGYLAIWEIL
jgi:hypothetical protein